MQALTLVIGDKNLSSWSLRPWLLLRHAEIAFTEERVVLDRPETAAALAAASPSRRVPVLRIGRARDRRQSGVDVRTDLEGEEILVWDSLAICETVAELFPAAHLWPIDREARATARSVAAEMHAGFASLREELPLDVTARITPDALRPETHADIARIVAIWTECRTRHEAYGPFLFGRFSIADAMFAPVVFRFRTYGIATNGLAARYVETLLALPAMRAWEDEAAAEVARRPPSANPLSPRAAFEAKRAAAGGAEAPVKYAVIFASSHRGAQPHDDYAKAADAMVELAAKQPGFCGIESARAPDGFGITVSYWDSLEAVARWKAHPQHRAAQSQGREIFYERYQLRVCSVLREHAFRRERDVGSTKGKE